MANIEVTAKKGDHEATVMYDFGDNLEQAIEKFGGDVVFSNFVQSAKISLQALMRSRMEKGGNVSELAEIWKPGIQLQRSATDVLAQAKAKFSKMTQEERLAYLEALQASM
jgi:exonuclease VII small subunit